MSQTIRKNNSKNQIYLRIKSFLYFPNHQNNHLYNNINYFLYIYAFNHKFSIRRHFHMFYKFENKQDSKIRYRCYKKNLIKFEKKSKIISFTLHFPFYNSLFETGSHEVQSPFLHFSHVNSNYNFKYN